MKASRCSLPLALRTLTLLTSALLLCQCSLPPRQAWQYIQSKGLLTYWSYESGHACPPFRPGQSRTQSYAGARTGLVYPRYGSSSSLAAPRLSASPYGPFYSQNRYYSAPAASTPSRSSSSNDRPVARITPRPKTRSSSSSSSGSRVRIPMEEPEYAPKIAKQESSSSRSSSKSSSDNASSKAAPKPAVDLPYGSPVPGRTNMVHSPYAGKSQLVDVSGMGAGQTVKCPYSGKLFKVPSSQQAANKAESKIEPKSESKSEPKSEPKSDKPKVSDEPKSEDKKP